MALEYYVIDTETTGLKAGFHEVIEISIIRCKDRHQLTKQIKAEHPERADSRALEVCKKSLFEITQGDDKEYVVDRCEEFWNEDGLTPEHRCLIAHNANFDKRFCHALWQSVGKTFSVVCWLDTVKFTKDWAKKKGVYQKSFTLEKSLKFADITPLPGKHAAGADARNTYLLWKKGMDQGVQHLSAIKRWPHKIIK
jgi:DNA polymerase III alpha subunit (gram-positive type)